jgi:hypothetical protein
VVVRGNSRQAGAANIQPRAPDLKISVPQNAEGAAVIKDPSEPIGSNVFVW